LIGESYGRAWAAGVPLLGIVTSQAAAEAAHDKGNPA
jgi:hypothetical protein